MLTLPKGTLLPPPSLSTCSHHSNTPSFSVIRVFYHARTPSSKYAFPPPPTTTMCPPSSLQRFTPALTTLRHALRNCLMNWYSSIVLRPPASERVLVYTLKIL